MAADRAINMALRVLGIGEVERDFKRIGDAGDKSFAEVKKAANGAALEVSDYTARLKRAADLAKQMAANTPALSKGSPEQIKTNRRDFILGAVRGEQDRILQGLPDASKLLEEGAGAAGRFGLSIGALTAIGTAAGSAIAGLALAIEQSLVAWSEHEKAVSAFNATIALSGDRSLASAAQIREMGQAIVASSGQTEASVLQAGAALAKIPGLSREGLQAALDASAKLADALGTDVASVVNDQVIPAFQALAQHDMKALYDATADLNPQLRLTVLSLAEAGRTADAQRALVDGLAKAAGDGPGGLTSATNRVSASWTHFKQVVGEEFAGPAASALDLLSNGLQGLSRFADSAAGRWVKLLGLLSSPITIPAGIRFLMGGGLKDATKNMDPADSGRWGGRNFVQSLAQQAEARQQSQAAAEIERRWGSLGDKKGGGRAGGGRGRSEKDNSQREADQARAAADRIEQANADVVKSWQQRTADVEARVGREGDALKAIEDQQEVEAAVRRINTDAIEKEVEARRKAAAAGHQQFDEAVATKAATAAVEQQQAAVRDLAERYVAANRAQAEFTQRQQEAKSIVEGLKSPIEKLNDEIERAIDLLKNGNLSSSDFDKRLDQLSHAMARANLEADKGKQIWKGFGDDVGRTLSDFILRGGSAREVLQRLIQLPLERLLYKNVEQPVSKFIDGLFGVDEDKNAAKIKAGLPSAKQILGASVTVGDGPAGLGSASAGAAGSVAQLGTAAEQAAQALAAMTGTGGGPTSLLAGTPYANDNLTAANDVAQPLDEVGTSAKAAGQAMQQLVPLTGQFGGALNQVIASLSASAGGGGGGLLGSVLKIGGSLLGGGISAGTVARLTPSAASTIAANPALFASGTDDAPVGRPFWVGENGRELMEFTSGGKLRVQSNQRTRRLLEDGGGASPIVQHFTIPERADPRRTASSVARATQGAIARSARKGLAGGK